MKKIKIDIFIKPLVWTAVIYLLTLTGAAFLLPGGAYIHIGDVGVYAAALMLPTPVAIAVSVFGCALADITISNINYAFATVFVKTVTVLVAKLFIRLTNNPLTQDALICLCGAVTVGGYYVFDFIMGNRDSALVFANVLQALICAVLYMIVSVFLRKKAKGGNSTNE